MNDTGKIPEDWKEPVPDGRAKCILFTGDRLNNGVPRNRRDEEGHAVILAICWKVGRWDLQLSPLGHRLTPALYYFATWKPNAKLPGGL